MPGACRLHRRGGAGARGVRLRRRFVGRGPGISRGSGLDRLRQYTEWENYGGAPLLGLKRNVVLTQAGADARPFVNAIRLAAKLQRHRVVDGLAERLRGET